MSTLTARTALPVIVAPMFLVSGPELVNASRRNGAIASFPFPNARTTEILDTWLEQTCRTEDAEGGPFAPVAANMITHSSYDRLADELDLVRRHKPDIVITALGGPQPVLPIVRDYGGLVFADVNSIDYARKAASLGVDGLVLICSGAGGHTGAISPFAFVTAVREFFDGIIVLGGGIATGGAVRAAEVLGADFAYMGTGFLAAKESMASDDYRRMVIEADYTDLVASSAFTGARAYYLRQSLEAGGYDVSQLDKKDGPDFAKSQSSIKAWRDLWSAGHGVGSVHAVEPAGAIIDRLRDEYAAACDQESAYATNLH
ncbi:MAG: nitronate monooxygenase [Pseudomonadota bacterium]